MTSSFQGISGGGGAFNPSQLGEYASGIRRQNEITQRDTKAFNNSVNANDKARMEAQEALSQSRHHYLRR